MAGYEDTFATFDANNGGFVPTWNGAALVFGPYWYLYHRRGTQLWEGAGSDRPACGPTRGGHLASRLEVRLEKLVEIKERGLVTEEEYAAKRARMVREAECRAVLGKLDEAARLGLLDEEEYESKRVSLLA